MPGRAGLSHVELYVSDLTRSIEFWGWLLPRLGFEPYQSWDEGRSWRCGDAYVVIVQSDEPYRHQPFHRKRPGLNHLAFLGRDHEHVLELTDQLRQRGVRVLYDDRAPGELGTPSEWAVYFEDPDRIKVEVVATE